MEEGQRKKVKEREISSILWFTPWMPTTVGVGQAEVRSHELNQGFPHG